MAVIPGTEKHAEEMSIKHYNLAVLRKGMQQLERKKEPFLFAIKVKNDREESTL